MRTKCRHSAFTLVEVLVVIIIIGILAGLLIPAIGSAMRRAKEFTIQKDIKDLEAALESFKQKYGVYPIDFSVKYPVVGDDTEFNVYRDLMSAFVDRLSERHVYGNAGYGILDPGTALANPWFGVIPGSPATRSTATMSATEGYVFLLGELSNNPEYPLGYLLDGSLDPNGQPERFYDFRDEDMSDVDQDGWAEWSPRSGPRIPYCYFDSRSYQQLQRTVLIDTDANGVDLTEFTERLLNFIKVDEIDLGDDDAGWCYPYLDFDESARQGLYVFEEPEKYQILSAGMDGSYGKGAGAFPGLRYSKNEDAGLIIAHRDNLVSFREGRMDNEFE